MGDCIVITDIDQTIMNTDKRAARADEAANRGTQKWWDAFFNPKLVVYDEPIGYSRLVLLHFQRDLGCRIVYLSARRLNMKEATIWSLDKHQFPKGDVLLRPSGESTEEFKAKWAKSLMVRHTIKYAIDNDMAMVRMYQAMGIPAIHIEDNSAESWAKLMSDLMKS